MGKSDTWTVGGAQRREEVRVGEKRRASGVGDKEVDAVYVAPRTERRRMARKVRAETEGGEESGEDGGGGLKPGGKG